MTWEIRLPMRAASEPLDADALTDLPNAIDDPQERQVVRGLMLNATMSGIETVGELADSIERAPQSRRRAMLDRAREAVGLPSAERADIERRSKWPVAVRHGELQLTIAPHGGLVDLQEQEREREKQDRDRRVIEARRRQEQAEREANPVEPIEGMWPANIPRPG